MTDLSPQAQAVLDAAEPCVAPNECPGLEAAIAADLLERQAAPVPVPVSERLPGPEDCDAGGRCWAWDWLAEKWCLCDRTSACHGFDHWLPAHALPLPQGEVEP